MIVVSSRQALQRAADGQPIAIIELNSDVTERKLVEVELRRLAAGVDSSADAILSKDRDCRITSWNRGAERLYGYTASEIVGQPVGVLVPADRAGEEQAILDRALRGEDVGRYETQRLAKDGTVIDVSITVSPIHGPSGDVIGASSIHRDITEQKRAEEELRLRAELLDLAHDAVIVRDPAESRVTFWNREAQAIYGYSPAEALGRVTHELLATVFPESRQTVDDALAREGRWGGELRHTRKDGTVIVVSSRQALQRAADGRPSAIIELNSDITERKRAEQELAHIAGLLERTEEISKTGGWEYDVATGELTWTDEVYRIYGVERTSDPTEVTQAIAAFDPESAPVIDAAFKRLVAEGVPYDLELGLIRADGQRIWVRTIGRPVIDDGRVVRVGGNISDVTERKRVEEALRASDQLFHSGFDDSPAGMALTGLDGRLVEVNAAFARMLGFDDPAQLAGQDFARFTHPDDVAANREGIRMMVEERKPYVAEKRYIRRDGAVVYALMGSTAVLDADGRPSMLFTQVQDITERKRAEAALRASEERFRGGFENSPIGMALVDPDGRYLEVNATHARMLGVEDPHEMIGLSFEFVTTSYRRLRPSRRGRMPMPTRAGSLRSTPRSRGCSATTTQPSWRDRASRTLSIPTKWLRTGDDQANHGDRGATTGRGATSAGTGLSCTRCMGRRWCATRTGDRRCCSGRCRTSPSASSRRPRCVASTPSSSSACCSGPPSSGLPIRSSKGSRIRSLTTSARRSGRSMDSARRCPRVTASELGDQGRETLDRIRRASARMGELIDAMLLLSDLTRRELSHHERGSQRGRQGDQRRATRAGSGARG